LNKAVERKSDMRYRKRLLILTQGVICSGCVLAPQVDQVAWQKGAKRAFVVKQVGSVQEINLTENPCFANLSEEAFVRGKVFEVRYWLGKIMQYVPAYSEAAVELRAGDAVELLPQYCSNGEYPRITGKMTGK